MQNSMEVPLKTKSYQMLKQFHSGHISKKTKTQTQKDICTPIFTATLFTTAKETQKQLKCPSIDDWIKRCLHTHTHTHTHYSAIKKNEILPSAAI